MNKKQIISGALLTLITALIGSKLKEHILTLVRSQLSSDLEGPEKKKIVMEQLQQVSGDLLDAMIKAGSYFVSAAVDIAVAYLKSRLEGAK
jgi:hypothetical protein